MANEGPRLASLLPVQDGGKGTAMAYSRPAFQTQAAGRARMMLGRLHKATAFPLDRWRA